MTVPQLPFAAQKISMTPAVWSSGVDSLPWGRDHFSPLFANAPAVKAYSAIAQFSTSESSALKLPSATARNWSLGNNGPNNNANENSGIYRRKRK